MQIAILGEIDYGRYTSTMTENNLTLFNSGIHFLAANGLNLFASLEIASLPKPMQRQMQQNHIPLDSFSHLMMTGHGGKLFWEKLQEKGMSADDPVDQLSIQLTQQFIDHYLGHPACLLLYPLTQFMVPLTQLGELANWSHPAPIGQGINPEYGVWFAYRTAFLVNGRFPTVTNQPTTSPCHSCTEKPCITACPSGAVTQTNFDIFTCTDFRVEPESPCADRCLARMTCPVAPEHQYTLPQIQYHYTQSLDTIKAYKRGEL